MFDNKSLQLASYGHLDYHYFQSFLNHFKNASLVNLNGDLLFSRDTELCSTTTSRLVSYQIVKKYLKLNPGDIFITNDPENGGYSYSKVFFISSLTTNLFLIWSDDISQVQFKIPLSPLVEAHKKNAMLWSMMIEPHPQKQSLTEFFEQQIEHYTSCFRATPYLDFLSEPDFQQIWFKTCKAEFDRQFDLRAQGRDELSLKYHDKLLKVALGIEEKQNSRTINIDFSSTQFADKMCAASHVIESAMIQEFVYHYKLHQFLSQPILNQIKLIMPPKSVVSKAHPTGEHNFELQGVIRQALKYLLLKMNSPKKPEKFALKSEAQLSFIADSDVCAGFLLDESFALEDLTQFFKPTTMSMKENNYHGEYTVTVPGLTLDTFYLYSDFDHNKRFIKINNKSIKSGRHQLKENDQLSIHWKI
ncbi:hypothetical protein [Pseudobdellovibrio sp. HCB154]|uniref:hypothetical protein n=1 Tax=Pseudobdellovibrio sp. HCB154 TaxID=3386277 RepID=UPI003916F6A1